MNITHITSVHPRFDTRIFQKMCRSLTERGHKVSLVVADSQGNAQRDGITIYDVGASKGRFDRIRNAPGCALKKAVELDAVLYHLHDPELIPIGLKLKKLGKRVIFDSHEDVPRQMLSKPYLNRPTRWVIAQALRVFETWACKQFDGVISATPFIRDKFMSINPNSIDINNFPLLDELRNISPWADRKNEVCYVGAIGKIRGIQEICTAMGLVQADVRLNLAGSFSESTVRQQVKSLPGWQRVNELGFVDRDGVRAVLSRSIAGLVTLHPVINYIDALPVKMFEYMSAGIPVIASDFPLWRSIIESNGCGLMVDPLKPDGIAKAIDKLVSAPDMARQMGENGSKAVEERYNWQIEEQKLLAFYETILSSNPQ
jgi:glycosyltransferase involved in cell wall biosynthesis